MTDRYNLKKNNCALPENIERIETCRNFTAIVKIFFDTYLKMEVLRPPELVVDDNDIRKDISSDEFKKFLKNPAEDKSNAKEELLSIANQLQVLAATL